MMFSSIEIIKLVCLRKKKTKQTLNPDAKELDTGFLNFDFSQPFQGLIHKSVSADSYILCVPWKIRKKNYMLCPFCIKNFLNPFCIYKKKSPDI